MGGNELGQVRAGIHPTDAAAERLLVDSDRALPWNSCWLPDPVAPVWAARNRLPAALPTGACALIRILISRLC